MIEMPHLHRCGRSTRGNNHIVDLTDEIQDGIRSSGLLSGQGVAMVAGSTAALTATEFEPGLVERDLAAALESLGAPGWRLPS
jgi:thiamine phosphate synthase YjbQ (UPF0047 family)